MTHSRETMVELITAALLALIVVLYLVSGMAQNTALLLGGVVLLVSGGYQTSKGWHVSLLTWTLGLLFTLAGIGLRVFLVGRIRINWLPILLLLIAGIYVWNWWQKRR